jgi:arylsulfatase A-like enzyme
VTRLLPLIAVLVLIGPGTLAAPPNIILVITDDQGYGDIAFHGNEKIVTPHLDRLARESTRLTDFHVDPTCSPTRAALLTGRYSTRTGVWHTVMGRSLLYHDEVTLADVLAANGYRNGMFGKWHLGDNFPMRPEDRGFHHVVAHGGGGIGQTPDYWGNTYFDDHYLVNGQWTPFTGYCTDVFFDEALTFIERHRTGPFFVYLSTNVPHGPYRVPDRYRDYYLERGVREPMASFYGMIENFDENMGRLLSRLDQWDLADNTILIFTTDNGTAAGVAPPRQVNEGVEWPGFNAGMRGQKGSPYDGGHRVPCFIRWPAGAIGADRELRQLTAHFDLFPTLVELAAVEFTPPNPLDGLSLVPLLRQEHVVWPERTLFVHTQREEIPPKWRNSAVLIQDWRLINGEELYDLTFDPGQTTDLAVQHPDRVAALRAAYEAWWTGLEPSFSRYAKIVIGAPQENPAHLTCMDWHADLRDIPWDQSLIDRMPPSNGYWMIDVARAGHYEFVLRHKPAVAEFPLRATRAEVRVGAEQATMPVLDDATEARLALNLPAGPARLDTRLTDAERGESRGAFFVEIRRVEPD